MIPGPDDRALIVVGNTGTLNITDRALLEVGHGYLNGVGGELKAMSKLAIGTINMSGGELLFEGPTQVLYIGTDLQQVGILNISGGNTQTD